MEIGVQLSGLADFPSSGMAQSSCNPILQSLSANSCQNHSSPTDIAGRSAPWCQQAYLNDSGIPGSATGCERDNADFGESQARQCQWSEGSKGGMEADISGYCRRRAAEGKKVSFASTFSPLRLPALQISTDLSECMDVDQTTALIRGENLHGKLEMEDAWANVQGGAGSVSSEDGEMIVLEENGKSAVCRSASDGLWRVRRVEILGASLGTPRGVVPLEKRFSI